MPLTADEYVILAKTILYSKTVNLTDETMVNKEMMFSILNDYCPSMTVSYKREDGKESISFLPIE